MIKVSDIYNFNKKPSKELFKKINDVYFPNRSKCKICANDIYYETPKFRIKRTGNIEIVGKSFQTTKKYGENLEVCEKCIIKKYPEYKKLNKSRIFNTLNEITLYAFDIKDENKEKYKTGVNEKGLIRKYGIKIGKEKWKIYKEKQAFSNSLEYKQKKYGWDKKKWDKFNNSRAVTEKNLIKKYGIEIGKEKWNQYIEKQKITKSFQYMVNKFGFEKAKAINKSKALTLDNFIKKYGNEKGKIQYKKHLNKIKCPFSMISQKLFDEVDQYLKNKYTTYYATKNKEFSVFTSNGNKTLDYFIKELNIAIEFNGDIFHANPKIYNENDNPNFFNRNLTAKMMWQKDKIRYEILEKEHNIKTIVIWESEYNNENFNIQNILEKNGILF